MCLDKKGRMTICEIKSCREDFCTDTKWSSYLEFCDEFFFVVDEWFPVEILPKNQGIIRADAFQAVILRQGVELTSLAPARRKTLLQKFAFQAANRLNRMVDTED